ncbi:MAG: hypothetical protein M1468_00825 [Candidatus Thermoplasmatota archaeon]|nr:hypothetical protein [Candidatus Thermoplasmatota archaeon]
MIDTDGRTWSRLVFTAPDVRTDMLLYRDRSYLLIPARNEENIFVAIPRGDRTEFYVSSSSLQDHANIREFFRKLYACELEKSEPPDLSGEMRLILVNSFLNRRVKEFHFSSLIASVVNFMGPIEGSTLRYAVKIRSYTGWFSREKRFSFIVFMSISGNKNTSAGFEDMVRKNLRRMRRESGWRMKIKVGRTVRFRTDTLSNPFCLNPFVIIPEDEN